MGFPPQWEAHQELLQGVEKGLYGWGLPGQLVNDFRRTAVRNLDKAGVSKEVAKKMTGHKTDAVFAPYNMVSERDLRDAARLPERATGTKTVTK
ncbi:MAG: hypothetical protein ACRD1R_03860 [Acidobacteriota bacterium]